jgi:hypothetical protein
MKSPTTTNSSTSSASSHHIVGEPSSQGHSTQTTGSSTRSRGSRTETKWPEDKLTATGHDANFWPTPDAARDRFVLVCGVVARERVTINKAVVDLSAIEKDHLFTILEEKVEYLANLEEFVRKKAVKAAISKIGTLQLRFKAHKKKYVSEEETPFLNHAFLQQQDSNMLLW